MERAQSISNVVRLDVASVGRRPAFATSARRATFLVPFDRPAISTDTPRPRRVRRQQALARLAGLIARAPDTRLPLAAVDAKTLILPHQLEPLLACLAGGTRQLIADDVGLGKTIQAGLILAELVRREVHTRALVLMPASLRDQWAEELRGRFAIESIAADRAGLDALTRAGAFGANPWRRPGVWLATPDFLKQRHVLESMPLTPWDLLIIDEAHGVCGDSERYAACRTVAAQSRRVVLLTATPHSGDETRFSRLIGLGDLGEAHACGGPHTTQPPDAPARGGDALIIFRRSRRDLGWTHRRVVRWHHVQLSSDEASALDALAAFERAVVRGTPPGGSDHALLLLSIFRKRALSTFGALSTSLTRRLAWLDALEAGETEEWTQGRLGLGANDENDGNDGNDESWITLSSGLAASRERSWLRRVRQLTERAARQERKVSRVGALIRRAAEPVVVFTEFRDSLAVLERQLLKVCAVSILHGGQDAAERRQQLGRFLDGSASVLLATDVASQGLNLQSRARWVISLELPWNPARLEQRIGRVDRISQTRPTHFTLTVARHPAEQGLLMHLARRVLTAQRSFSADALDHVVPPESDVRAALLARPVNGAATTTGPTPPPPRSPGPAASISLAPAVTSPPAPTRARASKRWTRAAAVTARALVRRRALAARWRDPNFGHAPSVWARTTRAMAPLCGPGRSLLVLSVPLFDGNDELVEYLVVPVAAPVAGSRFGRTGPERTAAMADVAHRAVQRRLAKAMRSISQRAAALLHREDLLRCAFHSRMAAEVQPDLFSRREQRAFEDHAGAMTQFLEQADARASSLRRGSALRAGESTVEVALLIEP